MPFTASPAKTRDLVALPRIDTHTLHLDNFLNTDAALNGFTLGATEGRDALAQILNMQLDYKSFLDYTELTGRVESINALEFFNYESGLMERSVGIASIVAGSTAGLVQITLSGDSYTSTGSINGAQDRSPLKVNDLVLTKNLLTGVVVAKSGTGAATVYTIQRRDAVADDLQAALASHLANSVRLITYSMAFAEGSKSPDEGAFQSTIRLMGQMQTFRSKDVITGDVDTQRRSIPFDGKTWMIDVTALKQEWHHRLAVNRAMYLAPGGNITLPGTGAGTGRVRLTTGLIPGVQQVGANFTYDGTAGYSAADIDALDALAKANYSGSSFTVFEGYKHGSAFYQGIRQAMGGAVNFIDYSAFGTKGDPKKKAIELGFNSIGTPGGISYHRQESNFFNEPEVTGTAGYPFPGMAIFIPGGQQNITVDNNGLNEKIMVPSLRLLHTTASNGDKRRYHTFYRGIEQDGVDEKKVETITQQGIQVVNLRNFILSTAA